MQVFAGHHPALFADLAQCPREHLQASPAPANGAKKALWLDRPDAAYILNCDEAEYVHRKLAGLSPERRLVQIFHSFEMLVRFLKTPRAAAVLRHPRWVPLLPMGDANHVHVFQCFDTVKAQEWPWEFQHIAPEVLGPSDAVAKRLLMELGIFLGMRIAEVSTRLCDPCRAGRPTPAEVLRRGERPLRVVCTAPATSTYQRFCARDMADGLRELGVDARLLLLDMNPSMHLTVLETIEANDPDVLFAIGMDRGDLHGLPDWLCVLSWDQDDEVARQAQYVARRGERDRVLTLLSEWADDAVAMGVPPHAVRQMEMGANTLIYRPPERPVEPEFDCLFFGNHYPFDVYMRMMKFGGFSPPIQAFLTHAREAFVSWIGHGDESRRRVLPNPEAFIQEVAVSPGAPPLPDDTPWKEMALFFRNRIMYFVLREECLRAVADIRLGLYGRNWDKVQDLARHARGFIENGAPLRDVIHRSAVVLHLHAWPSQHPRLFDTTAAGACLLVARSYDEEILGRFFEIGREIDTFGSIQEMVRKTRFYLEHPQERAEMAARGMARTHREHTMTHRMEKVLEFLRA